MRDILPEKISKSQNLPQKISKSQKGLQGNSSGGSPKNLKKSESASKNLKMSESASKNLKMSESASKNLKKSLFCQKNSKSQSGYQLRYLFATQLSFICPGWVAVAVPFLQHSCPSYDKVGCSCGTFLAPQLSIMMSESQNVAKTISGWVAGESVCLRISIIKQT